MGHGKIICRDRAVVPQDRIALGGTLLVSEVDRFQGIEHDYTRLLLDLEFKFD